MPHIDSAAVTQIRAAFGARRHDKLRTAICGATLTLPAALEISAWLADASHNDRDGRDILESLPHPVLVEARRLILSTTPKSAQPTASGTCELSSISELNSADKRWWNYIIRFAGALESSGFEKAYAKALAYSFHEMADNVRQHAATNTADLPRALAGWHVGGDVAAFAVVDLGRGVRASLATNPKWKTLGTHRDALLAVVKDHATRKAGNQFGEGYSEVVQNFVSRNGALALRSGDVELIATGNALESSIRTIPCPEFLGTRIAAWCAPNRAQLPKEPTI